MKDFTVKKPDQKITMCIYIDAELKKEINRLAEEEKVSTSSFVEQVIRFVLSEKKKKDTK